MAADWSVDPFAGEIRDGYVYGRGALDTKSLGIMQLQAFIALHRARKPLRRPGSMKRGGRIPAA